MLAARPGRHVTAVDPAPRLLAASRQAARHEGLRSRFIEGQAASLPVPDRSHDVVLSNFGVVFARDADHRQREGCESYDPDAGSYPAPGSPAAPSGRWPVRRQSSSAVPSKPGTANLPPPGPTRPRSAACSPPTGSPLTSQEHHVTFHRPLFAVLRQGNEDTNAFPATSRYVVITAIHTSAPIDRTVPTSR